MEREGYIKFRCEWTEKPPFSHEAVSEINCWRKKLYDLGLIGVLPDGIGFGNISVRFKGTNDFIITGSGTGKFRELNEAHYTHVTSFGLERNTLSCEGPIQASSESMTHAVLYQADPEIQAVVHVHSISLWKEWQDRYPMTSSEALYGTPEMAREIIRVYPEAKGKHIIVMGGHEEGIVSFGKSLEEAANIFLKYI